jgi:transcription initiation factor TFIIIB Brf1 subunit/transcription initiation factor TFIIB
MHLNEKMTRKGMDIMQTAIWKEASAGKHPMGVAAALLYITQLDNNL